MALSDHAQAFLNEHRFASLATINSDGAPQLTVMWYLIRDNTLIFNTAQGRKKDRNLLKDQRVALCIEDEYRFVTISGVVRIIDEPETGQADIYALAERYHGAERAESMMRDGFSKERRISYYLPLNAASVIERGFDNE